MKSTLSRLAFCLALLAPPARAAITIPGANGTDGPLNITEDTVIDLGLAFTGSWDRDNTPATGKGVYDPEKWAVVFKYSAVTIAAGKTLTFKNHPSRAPVVWLVNGNVTINGAVSLDGQPQQLPLGLAEPGPGGFRGASGPLPTGPSSGSGFGPGGGSTTTLGGSFGPAVGTPYGYGNATLVPLVGGSGGAGRNDWNYGGGAGGGAILIAAAGILELSGIVSANGGGNPGWSGAGGSGGGIRLVSGSMSGSGQMRAVGGWAQGTSYFGRIRIERALDTSSVSIYPDPSVVTLAAGATAQIWPPAGAPEVKIVAIGGLPAPADPRATFGTQGADLSLPQTASTEVLIETKNVEQTSLVQVRLAPRNNAPATTINAQVDSVISASPLVVRWKATVPVNSGYSAVQVKVVRP